MQQNRKQKTVLQDAFDKGFIRAMDRIQKDSETFSDAVAQREFGMPEGMMYQIKKGLRHVPSGLRARVQSYLMRNFEVNPEVFISSSAPVFEGDGSMFKEPESFDYERQQVRSVSGKLKYIAKLEDKNKMLVDENERMRNLLGEIKGKIEILNL